MGTANLIEAQQLFHAFEHQFYVPARPIQAPYLGKRPHVDRQCGAQEPPVGQQSGGRTRHPSLLVGFAPYAAPGGLRRGGRQVSRHQPDGVMLLVPDTPPVPLPCRVTRRPPPCDHVGGFVRRRDDREGGGCDPHHDVRLLASRRSDARAIALPVVGDCNIPGVQRKRAQTFAPQAIGDPHLSQPAGGEVIG